jgi:hypothetical protein
MACFNGLQIAFGGTLSPQTSYQIEVATVTPTEWISLMTCSIRPEADGVRVMTCPGSMGEFHGLEPSISMKDVFLDNVVVIVSSNGAKLTEQRFDPMYEIHEPNGPGCGGTCKVAGVKVIVPST